MPAPSLRRDAHRNRVRLIEAAERLFAEQGLDVEMKTIAEEAGVGVGTIYRNFPTRHDLHVALVNRVIDLFEEKAEEAFALESPADVIYAYVAGSLDIVDRFGYLAGTIATIPDECVERVRALDVDRRLAGVVRAGQVAGAFRSELDPDATALWLIASVRPDELDTLTPDFDRARFRAAVLDLSLAALRAHSV